MNIIPCELTEWSFSVYSTGKPTIPHPLLSIHTSSTSIMAWSSSPYTVCSSPNCEPHIW
jgi:hypothetical protein